MACNNRLLNLPLELFFKITNQLSIFDLNNMEKSGLFKLNDQGISDVIQAAFERPRHINIHIGDMDDQKEIKTITELSLRCGTGLRSLIVQTKYIESFLHSARKYDEEFGLKLAASCPNIERFYKFDYYGYDSEHAFRDYIRNIKVSKLVEISGINVINLTHDDLQILFTPSLKSVTVNFIGELIELMEELSVSRPDYGTHIERLTIIQDRDFDTDSIPKLINFFPNLKTVKVKREWCYRIKCVYNLEQINRPDFLYQFKLFAEYHSHELPYIYKERGKNFDLSAITNYEPGPLRRFDADVFDRLANLQSLQLRRNDMMSDFLDYLSDATFKSLKKLNIIDLYLNKVTLPKFAKILLTDRFFIRCISDSYAFGVHAALIPLLHKYCRNVKHVYIKLEPADTLLSTVEIELLKEVGIGYELDHTSSIVLHKE